MQRMNKPVIKVVRQGEGRRNNESTPMAFENIKQVIDDMATDATMFDVNKKSSRRAIVRWRFLSGVPGNPILQGGDIRCGFSPDQGLAVVQCIGG